MRWAGLIGVALLLCTGCAHRGKPVVPGDAQLAQQRRSAPRPDPLASPKAQADTEVKRLTALRDALQAELRSAEDQLLIVVVKSADYDEQAGRKLDELQQRRLLITVALRDIEQQRRQRAEDVLNGLVDEPPPTEQLAQELDEEGKLKDKTKAAGIEALLARAKEQLARARLARDRGMRFPWQSPPDSFAYGMGAAAPKPAAAATRSGDDEWKSADKKESAGKKGWAAAEKDSDRRAGETTIDLGEGWANEDQPPPPPSGGAVQAAAVVTGGAAPDLSAALRPLLPRMQACIPKPKLSQGLAFTIRARLGTDGTVRGARLSSGHGLPPAAAACVVDVMRQMRLPKGGGGRIVSVPLRLSAR